MNIVITFSWWMLPLGLMWVVLLALCIQNYFDIECWAIFGFIGAVITFFALLTRFLP